VDLNEDDVIQILKFMDQSNFGELHLEMGSLKVIVNKNGVSSAAETRGLHLNNNPVSTVVEAAVPAEPELPAEVPESSQNFEAEIAEQGLIAIKSPMLGTFYGAPKPGEPPFADVGAVVDEKTTVCIIEVMKLYSSIPAGFNGCIKRVCAEDGQLVEFGQVLFLVEPIADRKDAGIS